MRHYLLGLCQCTCLFLFLKKVNKSLAKILCYVFSVSFLHLRVVLQVLLFENKFFFMLGSRLVLGLWEERVTMAWSITWFSWLWWVPLAISLRHFRIASEPILIFDQDKLLLETDFSNLNEKWASVLTNIISDFDNGLVLIFLISLGGLNVGIKALPYIKVEQFLSLDSPTDNISSQTHIF